MFITRNRRTLGRYGAAGLVTAGALVLGGCSGDTAGPETGIDVGDIQKEFARGNLNDTAFSDFNGEPYIQASTIDTTLTTTGTSTPS